MKLLKFNHFHPPYNAGEVAGFYDEKRADELIAKGAANLYDPDGLTSSDGTGTAPEGQPEGQPEPAAAPVVETTTQKKR